MGGCGGGWTSGEIGTRCCEWGLGVVDECARDGVGWESNGDRLSGWSSCDDVGDARASRKKDGERARPECGDQWPIDAGNAKGIWRLHYMNFFKTIIHRNNTR